MGGEGGLTEGEALPPLRPRPLSFGSPAKPTTSMNCGPASLPPPGDLRDARPGWERFATHTPAVLPTPYQVIYEMHVRGFTRDDSSKVASPGVQGERGRLAGMWGGGFTRYESSMASPQSVQLRGEALCTPTYSRHVRIPAPPCSPPPKLPPPLTRPL